LSTRPRRALITGITGQDGAYLSQLLIEKGYEVHGLRRDSGSSDVMNSRLIWVGVADKVILHDGNLTDLSALIRILTEVEPQEVYNLAAQSIVRSSWQQPLLTGLVTGLGAANMLEAVRLALPRARFYQASSSEMFGLVQQPVQTEKTPFYPRSPYAAAKVYAHWMTVNYRESLACMRRAGSCSIMNRRCGESTSSPARSVTVSPVSSSACRNSLRSAISTLSAIGATRAIT
jgi:GDPmannose 4,6-dehydratase